MGLAAAVHQGDISARELLEASIGRIERIDPSINAVVSRMFQQARTGLSGLPQGPLVLVVHIASVWVPFTSESKEAIAHYEEIIDEIKRCVMDCGRELGRHLSRQRKHKAQADRRSKFNLYCGELVEALHFLTKRKRTDIKKILDQAADHYAEVTAEVSDDVQE